MNTARRRNGRRDEEGEGGGAILWRTRMELGWDGVTYVFCAQSSCEREEEEASVCLSNHLLVDCLKLFRNRLVIHFYEGDSIVFGPPFADFYNIYLYIFWWLVTTTI